MPMEPAAVIFDLDGLLVDSEPLWVRAEREVFASAGVVLSAADCAQTTGLRVDEVCRYWAARRPWAGPSPDAVADRVVDRVEVLLRTEARPQPGAVAAVARLSTAGLALAVASSSSRRLIDAALERLALSALLPTRCSAEDEPFGKPHPAVYLSAAAALGRRPETCVAVEDSLNGVVAAVAARMPVIAVPDRGQRGDPRFCLADRVLPDLDALDVGVVMAVQRSRTERR